MRADSPTGAALVAVAVFILALVATWALSELHQFFHPFTP